MQGSFGWLCDWEQRHRRGHYWAGGGTLEDRVVLLGHSSARTEPLKVDEVAVVHEERKTATKYPEVNIHRQCGRRIP